MAALAVVAGALVLAFRLGRSYERAQQNIEDVQAACDRVQGDIEEVTGWDDAE